MERLIQRNAKGVIYDFKGDYVSRFYDPERDILFNPLDSRSAGWNLFSDIKTKLDINVMASSLIPPVYTGDTFWNDAARGVFSGILHYLWQHDRRTNSNIWTGVTAPGERIHEWLRTTPEGQTGFRYIEDASSKHLESRMHSERCMSGSERGYGKPMAERPHGACNLLLRRIRINNHTRWYLLILIDFFSRCLIAWDICPSVNSSHITHIYKKGLKDQGIKKEIKPELRVDRGSPNTSLVTREFFTLMGADLSFARVRRPTDNALTERFFGTAKQEEIYIVGNYPDPRSAHEEIGEYCHFYNNERPHQSLWNFTPASVHETNNNTVLLEKLAQLKYEAKMKRRLYWEGKHI